LVAPRWVRTRWFVSLNRRAYGVLPDAELYIVHSFPLAPAVLRKALGRRSRRFTYDAHDAYFALQPGRRMTGAQRAWSLIERITVMSAAGFSTTANGQADLLARRHRRRPVAIRNCHDRRLDEPVERDVRAAIGLSRREFLLVAVGNDEERMAVPLIRSLQRLPGKVHLACIGRGYDYHRSLVEELGLVDRVHFPDALSPTQVVPFISGADAAVIPYFALNANYAHHLPNKLFQATAAGLPLLYSPTQEEVAALARRYEMGIPVDTRSPASIATGIEALLTDGQRLQKLKRGAAEAAEAEGWEREEQVLARFVREALG
jgi:glycosyltransferase involved in cell wall biosynthesis